MKNCMLFTHKVHIKFNDSLYSILSAGQTDTQKQHETCHKENTLPITVQ